MQPRDRAKIREHALRAARVATIGVALAGAGCSSSHTADGGAPGGDAAADARPADAGRDGGDFDGVCPTDVPWYEDADCCERMGGFWSPGGGCGVPGPFVPPSMRG